MNDEPIDLEALKELKALIDSWDLHLSEEGDYAEETEAGVVTIFSSAGLPKVFMPTDVYWELRDGYAGDVQDTD